MASSHSHKFLLLANYILIGAATSCVFLILSLHLLPSLVAFFLILLHILTIVLSVSSSSAASSSDSPKRHASNMAAAVIVSILQGAVALLAFTTTDAFLGKMKSYVKEEDGVVILEMVGVLGLVVFTLELVVVSLTFFMRFYGYGEVQQIPREGGVGGKAWSPPFQV